jgi:DNA-binding GntR family transcriptional regulator
MTFKLDPADPDPLYLQLAEAIREQIARGELRPRQKLPTQEELADDHDLSRGTILRATNMLTEEGLIFWSKGKGLFVSDADVIEKWKRSRARRK